MSALPHARRRELARVTSQDDAHERIRDLLSGVVGAILEEEPALIAFSDHRPQRDRPSGLTWSGIETLCHVSAMLAADAAPHLDESARERLVAAAGDALRFFGLPVGQQIPEDPSIDGAWAWEGEQGERVELLFGVRVCVRAYSAPFLPGSLQAPRTTSPASPLSPPTPPPRPLR